MAEFWTILYEEDRELHTKSNGMVHAFRTYKRAREVALKLPTRRKVVVLAYRTIDGPRN